MATLTEAQSPVHARRPLSAGPFADWIDQEAARCRVRGDAWSLWLSGKIRELGDVARFVRAGDPETFDDRVEVLEEGRLDDLSPAADQAASVPAWSWPD